MRNKKIFGSVVVMILVLCLSTLVFLARAEKPSDDKPFTPVAEDTNYLPLVTHYIPPAPTPSPTASPTLFPTPTSTSMPPSGDFIVADHTSISRFPSIPESAVKNAAALKTLFMHQSTGSSINGLGLECLQGTSSFDEYPEMAECLTYTDYYYDRRNWNWSPWAEPMADAIAKTDEWVSVVHAEQQNYQVLGMKFCYVDGWNQDFEYYRQKMEELERAYPDKTFIWTTSVLWAKSMIDGGLNPMSYEAIQTFNQQLRAYAIAHNKILYDMADMESHDSNGNPCRSNNNYEALCEEWYTGWPGGGGGHLNAYGSQRLAKGFWWLMARISGWKP